MSADYVEIPPKYFSARGSDIDLALLRRPRAFEALRRRVFSLPARSRVRQRALGRMFAVVWETYEARDFKTAPYLFYAPDCELRAALKGRLDLPELAVGCEEVSRWVELWHEPFRDVRWRPVELVDGGEVAFFGVEMTAVGRASGVETQSAFFSAVWWTGGRVGRQFTSMDREEAREAAGFA